MIEGAVNAAYEAVIPLALQGPTGQSREVDAVIDTGFNGVLMLESSLVAELELPVVGKGYAVLANGLEEEFFLHSVTVLWDGQEKQLDAYASDIDPLVGMRMLEGYNLSVDVEIGGRVVIQAKA